MQAPAQTAVDNAGGIAVDAPLGLYHRVSGEILQHFIAGPAQNDYSIYAGLQSNWTDSLSTRLQAGRSLYNTALALDNNVKSIYGDARFDWTQEDGPWKIGGESRIAALSDDNRRQSDWVEASRSIMTEHVRAVYRFAYDDMRYVRPDYYSPAALRLHEFGPEFSYVMPQEYEFFLRYLPRYAQEVNQKSGIYQSVEASMTYFIGSATSLSPSYSYLATPSYNDSHYMLKIEHRF